MDGTLDSTNKAAVSANGLQVQQATAANLNATVVGTGTFVTQSTLAAETTKVIGVTRTVGNAGAVMDFAGQNAAAPANSLLVGAEFNTTPTTITSGSASPLQLDNAGNLLVNVKAGGAAGGTSSTVGSAAPATATAVGFSDGTNMQLGRIKAASTAPVATDPAIVVAISPNSVNANGSATSANSAPVVVASDQAPVAVKGNTVVQAASSTITRPANTTAYASGQLVANSVTAGSVNNLQFTTLARVSGGSGVIVGAQIQKGSNVITNAAFRLHLVNTAPTYTSAGDGSALSTVVVASAKGYLGYIDITTMIGFSDVAWGSGAPDNTRGSIPYVATAQTIFGLLEARGAYTPVSGEVFTITLDALQD